MTRLASWQDYGTHDESAYPELWRGCVGAWAPCLGPTGLRLHDLSRYRNWGTLTNMDAATDWVVSGGRYALDFDGVDDIVDVGVRGGDLTETIPFSVSMWALARATAQNDGLISRDQSGPFAFAVRFNGGAEITLLTDGVNFTGPTITTNVWFHLAVVLAPSLRQFYLNGRLTHETTAAYTVTANSDVLRIGCDFNPAADRCWNGLIDDVRIYNRPLNSNEARLLATRRGIAYERRKRNQVYFDAAFFNPAWARNSNVILSPVGAA